MREALALLGQALEKCRSALVWALPEQELAGCLDGWFRLRARLDALGLALIRDADTRGVAVGQGATSTTTWLRDGQRVSIHTASRLVKLAATVEADLPATGAALAAGKAYPNSYHRPMWTSSGERNATRTTGETDQEPECRSSARIA